MNSIHYIRFEDGPEDGLELTPQLLKKLVGGENEVGADISLFKEPAGGPRQGRSYLLGRYCLRQVTDGTAEYRWSAA